MLQNSVLLKSTSSPLSIKIKPKSLDFIGEGDGVRKQQLKINILYALVALYLIFRIRRL
jgi:hypothetical protein